MWYHSTLWVIPNKGYGPPIYGTAYISEVNRAKVKSDAKLAINKNSDPVQKLFNLWGWLGRRVPPTQLLELFETSQARRLIFGLQVDIDKHKANSRRFDVV